MYWGRIRYLYDFLFLSLKKQIGTMQRVEEELVCGLFFEVAYYEQTIFPHRI